VSNFKKQWLLGGAAMAALALGGVAHAADAAGAATGAEAQGTQVQEIVVTATRRSEAVQTVPGQVTALGSDALTKMQAKTFNDFATMVPGLSFQSNSPTNNLIAIRGVASSTAELGSAVAIYLDDVPLGASTQFGLGSQAFNFNLFDMDRVEVLNGPQGTLYGANALGGALKYVTAAPDPSAFYGRIETEGSTTEHGSLNDGLRFMVNMPLLNNTAALRIDALQQFDSGYTQDPGLGLKDVGSARTYAGRAAFLDHVTPDLDVKLSLFGQEIKGEGEDVEFENPSTHQPSIGRYQQSYLFPQHEDNSVWMASGEVNYDLHWAKLTSITSYQQNHGTYDEDVSGFYDVLIPLFTATPSTGTDPYDLFADTNTKKFTEEVRLASPDNKHFEWTTGIFYTHEDTDETVNLLDRASPSGLLPAPFSSLPFSGFLPSVYQEVAVFADATYFITDRFDVTVGARYSHQTQTYSSNIGYIGFGPPFGQINSFSSQSAQGVSTFLFNPRYRITDDVMVYGRVSSGFRPGGPNFVLPTSFNSPVPAAFAPDRLWNYEIGEKSTFLDHKATLNVDVYDIEWHGIQTTDNVNGINQLVNAGNARIQGAEAAFSYRPLPPLTLSGSAAYTDARLTTTAPVLGVDYSGARLPVSPKYNFAFTADYNFNLGPRDRGFVEITDAWVGDRTSGYFGSLSNVLYKLPAYNTVNINVGVILPNHVEVDAYLKNVFDTEGQLAADTLNNVFNPEAGVPVTISLPRTFGLVLKVPFGGG
jgi:outer membrane receptor protein involved in Fe transport